MTHIRIDNYPENSRRRFACGIGPELPAGDHYVFQGEVGLQHMVDCPDCIKGKWERLGTPLLDISGRPHHAGYERFVQIAKSWGYD